MPPPTTRKQDCAITFLTQEEVQRLFSAIKTKRDPDVLYDPGRCNLFWQDVDDKVDFRGNPKEVLTGRNVLILITWDGTVYNHHFRDPGMGSPPCPVIVP